jgi:hypothetical protein
MVRNQNSIYEEIKSRPNSKDACYQAVQNLLSFHLQAKKVKIEMHKTIVSAVLGGCEARCHTD